jgi:hypothetical protein
MLRRPCGVVQSVAACDVMPVTMDLAVSFVSLRGRMIRGSVKAALCVEGRTRSRPER